MAAPDLEHARLVVAGVARHHHPPVGGGAELRIEMLAGLVPGNVERACSVIYYSPLFWSHYYNDVTRRENVTEIWTNTNFCLSSSRGGRTVPT